MTGTTSKYYRQKNYLTYSYGFFTIYIANQIKYCFTVNTLIEKDNQNIHGQDIYFSKVYVSIVKFLKDCDCQSNSST